MHDYNHEEYFILFTESNVRIFGTTRKEKEKQNKQKRLEERQDTEESKL